MLLFIHARHFPINVSKVSEKRNLSVFLLWISILKHNFYVFPSGLLPGKNCIFCWHHYIYIHDFLLRVIKVSLYNYLLLYLIWVGLCLGWNHYKHLIFHILYHKYKKIPRSSFLTLYNLNSVSDFFIFCVSVHVFC